MTAEPHIDYEALAQGAMRAVVRQVLGRIAKSGLPGDHHFYIAFNTKAAGVSLSPRLRERYPEEMTVVLQHRFWDLVVTDDRFEVNLTFDSIPERLVVPFTSIKVFFDPSVPYGLQFDDASTLGAGRDAVGAAAGEPAEIAKPKRSPQLVRSEKKQRAPRKTSAEKAADKPAREPAPVRQPALVPAAEAQAVGDGEPPDQKPGQTPGQKDEANGDGSPKVVRLDAFRKK